MASIYIHVPFCKSRCIYCDFYSTTNTQSISRYIQSVCRELEIRKDYLKGEPVETIYFGGGTPSQLSVNDFSLILSTIESVYGTEHCKEVTLEANPDDLTPQYLEALSVLPFNRISMGIQTFNDDMLRLLKRRHSAQQAIQAVHQCRQAGFNNISIDLIYGLPGETLWEWNADLDTAINLGVEHMSAYHLIYEEDTPLYEMLQRKSVNETDEESSNSQFSVLIKKLTEAGYEQYEISNFSLPGKQSKHNSSYWNGTIYLGCGPSAHSFNGENRSWNVSSLSSYIIGIEEGLPVSETEILDKNTRYNDFIITSLRTSKGLSLDLLEKNFGNKYLEYCLLMANKHLNSRALEVTNGFLKLTRQGIFISDGIMSDILKV